MSIKLHFSVGPIWMGFRRLWRWASLLLRSIWLVNWCLP